MFAILALFPIERTHEEVKCVEQTFGATDQEWQDFIDRINRRMRSSGEDSDTKA